MRNSTRGRWLLPVLALAALIALSPATAEAQASATGDTAVTINMPDIVVLHYFGSVGVTIDTAALEAFLAFTGGDAVDEGASAAVTSWTQDLNISPTAPTGDVTAANLTLSNAWAVRAIGDGDPVSGGSIQTQIGITSTAFNDGGTGSIAVTPTVQVNGGGYAASQAFDSPGLVTPQRGDVRLALDLSNALQAGDYTGTYTLTVTNL